MMNNNILLIHNLKDFVKESAYQHFKDNDKISNDSVLYITNLLQDPHRVPDEYLAFDEPAGMILAEAHDLEKEGGDSYTVYKHLADASILNCSIFRDALRDGVSEEYYDEIGKMSCLKTSKMTNHDVFQDIFYELHNYYRSIMMEVRNFWKSEIIKEV